MNRSVVVTGGATGIGAATVNRLLKKGCDVYLLDVATPEDSQAVFIPCDLSDELAINQASQQLPPHIDALVHVAGISGSNPGALVMAVNFLGLRHLTETLLPRLKDGCVVIVASSAGRDWQSREADVLSLLKTPNFESGATWIGNHQSLWSENPYKFSKQCAAAYTHQATRLGLSLSVRVNCVNPGVVGTQLTTEFREMLGDKRYDRVIAEIGREGTPEDIADVIEFLSIGHCPWLNGAEIPVDGGYLSGINGGWIQPPVTRRR